MYQKPKPVKKKSKAKYVIVVLLAVAVGIGVYFVLTKKSTVVSFEKSDAALSARQSPSVQKPTRAEVDEYSVTDPKMPARIYMSRLGVVARIIPVDIKDGYPVFTANIFDVGWDKTSATPSSDSGAIIISGYETYDKIDGSFVKLKELNVGDSIIIEQGNGTKTSFTVTDKVQVSSDESANKTLRASVPTDTFELRLVTNAGDMFPSANGYQTRTIVTAKKQG